MAKKITKKQRAKIAGVSGIAIGIYMLLVLNNVRGLIPLGLGFILLFWRFK